LIGCTYPEGWKAGFEEDTVDEDMEYEYKEQFLSHDIEADGSSRRDAFVLFLDAFLRDNALG
jgi:hypothetical protein